MKLTMKLLVLLFAMMLIATGSAYATDKKWKGPGWYILDDMDFGPFIYAGTYTKNLIVIRLCGHLKQALNVPDSAAILRVLMPLMKP